MRCHSRWLGHPAACAARCVRVVGCDAPPSELRRSTGRADYQPRHQPPPRRHRRRHRRSGSRHPVLRRPPRRVASEIVLCAPAPQRANPVLLHNSPTGGSMMELGRKQRVCVCVNVRACRDQGMLEYVTKGFGGPSPSGTCPRPASSRWRPSAAARPAGPGPPLASASTSSSSGEPKT